MTREQKNLLATALISAAADMLEHVEDRHGPGRYAELGSIPMEEMQAQLSKWLGKLPGDGWDCRLPYPDKV